jgi:parallel beta-helix repeat protein
MYFGIVNNSYFVVHIRRKERIMGKIKRGSVFSICVYFLIVAMFGPILNVHIASSSGTIYIRADGSVDPASAPISSLDNITYTFTGNINDSIEVERNNIVIDGMGHTLYGMNSINYGIHLAGRDNVTIKDMKIESFTYACVRLDTCNNSLITQTNMTTSTSGLFAILLYYSHYNAIYGNNLTAAECAIELNGGSNNDIYENSIIKGGTVPSWGTGIWLEGSGVNNVHDNVIVENAGWGIQLHTSSSSDNNVYGNNITGSANGILLTGALNNTVSENIVRDCSYLGIVIWYSSNNILRNNMMINNTYNFGLGTETTQYEPYLGLLNDVDVSNTVDGKPVYYWIDKHDENVPHDAGTVILINCSNIGMDNLTLGNNLQGMYLYYSNGCTISRSNITRTGVDFYYGGGVVLRYSSDNSISENYFGNGNYYDVHIYSSKNNNVSKNIIRDSDNTGIYVVQYSNSNRICENTIASSKYYGIKLQSSCMHNTVFGNNITESKYYGLYLHSSLYNDISSNSITQTKPVGVTGLYLGNCQFNIVHENNIMDNYVDGVEMYSSESNTFYGNTIESNADSGIFITGSSHNAFYHNNIINNPVAAVSPSININLWNSSYPSGGNYWSSYTGVDIYSGINQNEPGSDGIGDSAYNIGGNNTDHYPLMGPFSNFSISYQGETCYIATSCNSTISDFQFNEAAKTVSFNVTGQDGTTGFCRAIIPNIIIEDLWQGNPTILVNGAPVEYRNWTDGTNTHLYFTYPHSEHPVIIVTEFLSLIILPVFMLATVTALTLNRKRKLQIFKKTAGGSHSE